MKNTFMMGICFIGLISFSACDGIFEIGPEIPFVIGPEIPSAMAAKFLVKKNVPAPLIRKLCDNTPLSKDEFSRLKQYSNSSVKRLLAENPSTPVSELLHFSQNPNYYIRRGVAINPKSPVEFLQKLAYDPNEYVRWSAAQNPSITADIYIPLLNSNDFDAHHGLASNPTVPQDSLIVLYNRYRNNGVLDLYFAMNPKLPENIAEIIYAHEKDKSSSLTLDWLVMNPSVKTSLLLKIHQNSRYKVPLFRFAQNPNCPEEIKTLIRSSGDAESLSILEEHSK